MKILSSKIQKKLNFPGFWTGNPKSWGEFCNWMASYKEINPNAMPDDSLSALESDLKRLRHFWKAENDVMKILHAFGRSLKEFQKEAEDENPLVSDHDGNDNTSSMTTPPLNRTIATPPNGIETPNPVAMSSPDFLQTSNATKATENPFLVKPYDKVVEQIRKTQQHDEDALTKPLWWAVIDLRQQKVRPGPDLPRAKDLLPEGEFTQLRDQAVSIISDISYLNASCNAFFEAISKSDITNVTELGEMYRSRGVFGIYRVLKKATDDKEIKALLMRFDEKDGDTGYIGECFSAVNKWIKGIGGRVMSSERTVDMFLIGQFAKAPGAQFLYGEMHSRADREEKASRSESARVGKFFDFLFLAYDNEIGVAENSGPACPEHHDKASTDFVDIVKVARAQHISLQNRCIEASNRNPLPATIQDACKLVAIPFFQVIGMNIRFYLLLPATGDVFALWEWGSEPLPTKDSDVEETLALCKAFLFYRNLLNRTKKSHEIAIKKAKRCRNQVDLEVIPVTEEKVSRKRLKTVKEQS